MDCAGYEQRLARLMAEECDEAERPAVLEELRQHAGACAACRGSIALLEVLALPPEQRDLVDEPDASYWDRFDQRLKDRVTSLPSAGPQRWRTWAAAAAALFALLAGLWVLWDGSGMGPAGPAGGATADGAEANGVPFPAALEELILNSAPSEALAGLDFLAGLTGLPDPAVENGPAAGTAIGLRGDDGWLFPDTENLDDETREELLEWLQERTSNEQGVRS